MLFDNLALVSTAQNFTFVYAHKRKLCMMWSRFKKKETISANV